VINKILIEMTRREIRHFVRLDLRRLTVNCWAEVPDARPSSVSKLDRVKQMKFKVAPKRSSSRAQAVVNQIEDYEQ
jgi:hypothetical protein